MPRVIRTLWFEDVGLLNEPVFDTPLGRLTIRQTTALKDLTKRELLELAEECDEVEIIRQRYYAWSDREVMIFLRLKGYGKGEAITPRGRRAEEGSDPPRYLRCSRCG